MTLDGLPVGKHLVRLERPGSKIFGALVEVTSDQTDLNPKLAPTPTFKSYDAMLDPLAREVMRNRGGATMAALAKMLALDRAIVGLVKEVDKSSAFELSVGLYDLKSGRRIASKKASFQGDEYGQLKAEVGRLVNTLVNAEGGEQMVKSSDPLDNNQGIEDWNAEDKGGARTTSEKKKKKKAGDPLDGVSGTEDW